MVAMFASIVIHICNCLVLVHKYDMGINGLATAASITNGFLLVSVFVYAFCSSQVRQVMQPIDREAFRSWWPYLKISLPATLMICSEWWAFEILTVLSGVLGVNELAS